MELYYDRPAGRWEETLPVGNGKLGGMIWGGVSEELIGLNEESLWSGYEREKNNPGAYEHLAQVRELVFQGKCWEAERLIRRTMLGEYTESYMPLGNLHIGYRNLSAEGVRHYERRLHLETALVTEDFDQGGVHYHREIFASYPGQALVIRLTSDRPVMELEISLESQLRCVCADEEDGFSFSGSCPEHVDPSYVKHGKEAIVWGYRGKRFRGKVALARCDGEMKVEQGVISLTHASEAVLTLEAAGAGDLRGSCEDRRDTDTLRGICEDRKGADTLRGTCEDRKGADTLRGTYEDWKAAHIRDYQSIYNKVELYLGEQKPDPTDVRLQKLKEGEEDNGLFALYFQYGRYLMISSSREGSLPANLQGIWSWQLQAPWSSNFTTNINLQMNYWPALSCGLEECLEPYFTFVEKLAEHGRKTAAVHYHCRGTVQHHNADAWYATHPMGIPYGEEEGQEGSVVWSMWPMGMAWLSQEFYRYYEYSGDLDFLRSRTYPLLRETVLFLVDWLVPYEGNYVTCPSTSPENRYRDPQGHSCAVTMASAMDMEIVREVFGHFLSVCRILGLDATAAGDAPVAGDVPAAAAEMPDALSAGDPLISQVRERLAHLEPVRIGSYGQILEWHQEYEETEPGHRHLSHLYGMFPSELWADDPEMEKAVRISLEHRLSNGGGYTGWSCAWIINLMAVLGEGEEVWKYLRTLLTRSTYPNLWDAHEPFQIDGNFGGIAGMAAMLVQDRGGKVSLLPALPAQFAEGYVKGLRIKNRKEVSLRWKDGKLIWSEIKECGK